MGPENPVPAWVRIWTMQVVMSCYTEYIISAVAVRVNQHMVMRVSQDLISGTTSQQAVPALIYITVGHLNITAIAAIWDKQEY